MAGNQEKKFGKNSSGQEAAFFVDEQEMVDGAAKVSSISAPLAPDGVVGTVIGATLTAVAAFATENITKLGFQLEVATATLDQLDVYVKYNADGDYIDLVRGVDWTTPAYPILACDIANDAAVAIGTHYMDIDVSAYYSVQLRVASSASSTVSVYPGGV